MAGIIFFLFVTVVAFAALKLLSGDTTYCASVAAFVADDGQLVEAGVSPILASTVASTDSTADGAISRGDESIKSVTPKRERIGFLPILGVVVGVGFVANAAVQAVSPTVPRAERQEELAFRSVIDGFLEEQRKGREGNRFWLKEPWVHPVQLFAVRSWEIVEISGSHVMVRVASSNRAGMPIEVLWEVYLKRYNDKQELLPTPLIFSWDNAAKSSG